jgi:polysaccharide biosynthesis transport protein
VEITQYLTPLRRWWWLLIVGMLVAAGASYLSVRGEPPIYQTSTTLMIGGAINNPNPDWNALTMGQQLANTYADIAQRAPVRKAVMTSLGLEWLPGYTVRSLPDTQLLQITVMDIDPARAQAVANELAGQLILQSPTGANSEAEQRRPFVKGELSDLETNIKGTRAEIAKQQQAMASMLSAREIADAQVQIASLQNKLVTLQANYAILLGNTQQGATNTLTVIEPAELPLAPVGPNHTRTLLFVAAIGFIVAAGAAYLLAYLDDTLKSPGDVKRELGLATLGVVPTTSPASNGSDLVMFSHEHSASAEAYRLLRTNLQFAAVDGPVSTLLITSPAPSEGKSLTTANLSVALAQAGKRVIVVDTDLHRPRLHQLFQLKNGEGLTSALVGERLAVGDLLQATSIPGLRVLTAGPLPPNPTELLGSASMRNLVDALCEQADIVLLDSPPATILADAAVLGSQVNGVLLVVEFGRTRRDEAKRAVETLRGVKAHLLGAVLNRVPASGAGYYYYYYRSYYSNNGKDGRGRERGRTRQRFETGKGKTEEGKGADDFASESHSESRDGSSRGV